MRLAAIGVGVALLLGGAATAAEPRPDLTGVWTNAWLTPMERPKDFTALVVSPADAATWEKKNLRPTPPEDPVGQADSEFPENGDQLARIRGTVRTSWIYDPPDGKIPYTEAAKAANKARGESRRGVINDPEQLSLRDRCMHVVQTGPPMQNGEDLNVLEIVQTPDHLAIVGEANQLVRIIPLNGKRTPHAPRQWFGESVGRWEGATLVVETVGFHPLQVRRPDGTPSAKHRVTERFTRTGPGEVHYAFTVENPDLYTRSWRGEMVLKPASRMFENACHEGNYAMTNILGGGRVADREAAEKAKAETPSTTVAGR